MPWEKVRDDYLFWTISAGGKAFNLDPASDRAYRVQDIDS
jgi:hypothetical protein